MAGAVQSGKFKEIDQYIARFQSAMQRVHYARKPVVVATLISVLWGEAANWSCLLLIRLLLPRPMPVW